MKAVSKILAGGIGLAALAGAAPAAAQYYPGYPGYGQGGGLGAIIDAILGAQRYAQPYGYGYNPGQERFLVEQCARATEYRIQRDYGRQYAGYGNPYGGYGNPYGAQGYNNYSAARILNITRIERRPRGSLKIYGIATTGRAAYAPQPYGAYGGYGAPYGGYGSQYGYNAGAVPDLRFDCTIDYRGRITDIDLDRQRF